MATQSVVAASFVSGACSVSLLYDDLSLAFQGFGYQNLTPQKASVIAKGPANFTQTWVVPPDVAPATLDLTYVGLYIVKIIDINLVTQKLEMIINPPAGWTFIYTWPVP